MVYLSASNEAISAVLVKDKDMGQIPF